MLIRGAVRGRELWKWSCSRPWTGALRVKRPNGDSLHTLGVVLKRALLAGAETAWRGALTQGRLLFAMPRRCAQFLLLLSFAGAAGGQSQSAQKCTAKLKDPKDVRLRLLLAPRIKSALSHPAFSPPPSPQIVGKYWRTFDS